MRILHSADWHVGRSFFGASLLDHQAAVLDAVVDLVRSEGVDVVVVAGDLYDRSIPPTDAVALLSETFTRLVQAGSHVIAITGNHDSATRVSFADRLLEAGGLHLCGDPRRAGLPVLLGGVAFYPIPYLEPVVAAALVGAEDSSSHDRVLRAVVAKARHDLRQRAGCRSVAIAHAFVTGGQTSESERVLAVGGSAEVGLGALHGFDYVALGHLHGQQTLGRGVARYPGSPLAYSFSERHHQKAVWIVDVPTSGAVTAYSVDLPVPRRLAVIEGTVDHLVSDRSLSEAEPSWVQAVVTDTVMAPDAGRILRRRFPHLAAVVHQPPMLDRRLSYAQRTEGRSDVDLFSDFWQRTTGLNADNHLERLFSDALSDAVMADCEAIVGDDSRTDAA
jgi:exonuclease SbcD